MRDRIVGVPAVLEFVNELRARRGMPALSELPEGTHSGYSCPIANALPGCRYASRTTVWWPTGKGDEMPSQVRRWQQEFDAGEHPDYEVASVASTDRAETPE